VRDHAMQEPVYDLSLFERLNEEYASKPLVRAAPKLDPKSRMKRARRKLRQIGADVDLQGKRVLELGCAHGQLTRLLVKKGGAREAIGVDVVSSPQWEELARKRVSFHVADLSRSDLVSAASVDVIVSNSVFEHVRRPLAMLDALARLLRPGGEAWLQFNLHRGPKASHRYREVFFPWPHLLFEPAVCAAFYRKHHGRDQTFAWVNRMTAAEYVEACVGGGLHIARHARSTTLIDVPFYTRFEDKLGGYPALDLETDFMLLVLKKRRRRPRSTPRLGYLERQRELDAAISPT
jgi:2-polyprenyl-3-methyl-5-hydroxy-6-metoxy-1,4-benzoquinol methylase